ncbi:carboxypeptidase-like regulatory domain-containing protein [Algoriphagus machipongonensis]|uniref:Outer membrane protein, probably involved in nutrient binding n=1 Tax=Algoriphagus machipongonensis TaxID=388413 RepID=A3HSP5_9BACT|nr:carboxypeptidase-like regulatory domain-containing protein [Algoriphagus machipongonensis]EAZ82863.1 putative outer membrane protein, probably involved in nutrient binding [Algoriphagus machipongonensis]
MFKNHVKYFTWLLTIVFVFYGQLSYSQTFQLKGRVLDSGSKEFLNGVSVTLKGTAFGEVTKGGGNFEIERVLEDKYTLSLTLPGYNKYEQVVRLNGDLDLGDIFLVKFGAEGTGAALQKTIRANNITNLFNDRPNMIGGNMVYGIPPEAKKVEGNNYLDTKWNTASLLLYRDQQLLEGFRVRYNIVSNMFELMEPENNMVSVMPGLRIQNFVWVDSTYKVPRYFVNGMDFKEEGAPISGFFEVLVDGELPLMRRTKAVFKESNYNEALMVGERNDKIIKRNTYYYLEDKDIIELPSRRKKIFAIFEDQAEEMEAYTNENSIDLKDPSGLFQLFTHYNAQFPGFRPIISQLLDETN